jgi:hypothetical protein
MENLLYLAIDIGRMQEELHTSSDFSQMGSCRNRKKASKTAKDQLGIDQCFLQMKETESIPASKGRILLESL